MSGYAVPAVLLLKERRRKLKMVKADDKVEFEDDGKKFKEEYSHFEFLQKKVEVLQEQIELIGKILQQKNITETTEDHNMSPDFDDETYRRLEEDD